MPRDVGEFSKGYPSPYFTLYALPYQRNQYSTISDVESTEKLVRTIRIDIVATSYVVVYLLKAIPSYSRL